MYLLKLLVNSFLVPDLIKEKGTDWQMMVKRHANGPTILEPFVTGISDNFATKRWWPRKDSSNVIFEDFSETHIDSKNSEKIHGDMW